MVNEVLLAAPLAGTIVLSVGLAIFASRRSRLRARKLFTVMILEVGILAALYWLELTTTNLEGKLFWNDLEYIVNVTIAPLFLLFVLSFLGREVRLRKRAALLFAVPALMLALLWTNDLHHLFYTSVGLTGSGWYTSFDITYGIGFFIHSAYAMLLLVIGVAFLSADYLRSSRMHRKQIGLVLVAAFIPPVCLVLGVEGVMSITLTYYIVVGFTVSGLLIFLGTFTYELFDVVPLALESIVDAVNDGIVVIDKSHRVLFANDLMLKRSGVSAGAIYARPLRTLLPQLTDDLLARAGAGERVEVAARNGTDSYVYCLKITPIRDRGGNITSSLLTMRDITDETRISEALRIANIKLNLLSSITRHDTMNQVTVVRSLGQKLAEEEIGRDDVAKFGQTITDATEVIERQFSFARDYQSLGTRPLEWQSVTSVFSRAVDLGLANGLRTKADLDELEVLSDPLLDRVFGILLDNTRRHGQVANSVTLDHQVRDGTLILTYRDDGVGVPETNKERIFERGYGRDSGLGLFLARQILDVNDATIREVGIPGKGATFEMTFPPGWWRVRKKEG
jgi:PAS domain S-box-containing protein